MSGVRQWKHWGTVRSALIVLLVFLAVRAYQTRDLPSGPAPTLSGRDLAGASVSLNDYRGKPVMVHFWATWCGVCSAMRHNVRALAEDRPVLTVASLSGRADEVRKHAAAHDLRFPIIQDPTGSIAKKFSVGAFPTTFVIDGDGNIRHSEVGYTTEFGMRVRLWLAGW